MTLEEFRSSFADTGKQAKFRQGLLHSVGNVRGTDQYWNGVRGNFKAGNFYLRYLKKKEMRYFATGSYAEFHDPFLRILLAKYVTKVEGDVAGREVMESPAAWRLAISKYKQVVTHFFAFKTEQWHGGFLYTTLDVDDFHGVFEFAKNRGAIHYHSMCASASQFDASCDDVLSDLCMSMNDAARRREEGEMTGKEFDVVKFDSCAATASRLNNLFERHLGNSAMHPGRAPGNWVKPGGGIYSGHRASVQGMLTKIDARDTHELSRFKFESETRLHERLVNVVNIAFTHSCSDYCWRYRHMDVPYDSAIHGTADKLKPDVVRVRTKASGKSVKTAKSEKDGKKKSGKGLHSAPVAVAGEVPMATVKVWDCRMSFGYKLKAPKHGSWCDGRDALRELVLKFDGNGQPSFLSMRNHPRVLQEPVHTFYWGANADLQRMLSNNATRDKFERVHDENDTYEDMIDRIDNICEMRGLEEGIGSMICEDYIVGYQTKGKKASKEWSELLQGMEDLLAVDKGDTPLRSVVGKNMHAIAKSRDRSKDEASFMLSGGRLTFSTVPVMSCSVFKVALEDICCKVGNPDSWTFESLRKR